MSFQASESVNARARADEAEAQKKALDDHIKTLKVRPNKKNKCVSGNRSENFR